MVSAGDERSAWGAAIRDALRNQQEGEFMPKRTDIHKVY